MLGNWQTSYKCRTSLVPAGIGGLYGGGCRLGTEAGPGGPERALMTDVFSFPSIELVYVQRPGDETATRKKTQKNLQNFFNFKENDFNFQKAKKKSKTK